MGLGLCIHKVKVCVGHVWGAWPASDHSTQWRYSAQQRNPYLSDLLMVDSYFWCQFLYLYLVSAIHLSLISHRGLASRSWKIQNVLLMTLAWQCAHPLASQLLDVLFAACNGLVPSSAFSLKSMTCVLINEFPLGAGTLVTINLIH